MVTSICSCQILSLYGKQPICSESSGQHEPPQQISSSEKLIIHLSNFSDLSLPESLPGQESPEYFGGGSLQALARV